MKGIEKINLVKNICDELNKKLIDYDDQLFVLHHNKIRIINDRGNDPDVKVSLMYADEEKLKKVADELEVSANLSTRIKSYPKCWMQSQNLKLFISHSSKQKDSANRLKETLLLYKIDCFVAHEDVKPTLEWQIEIEKALNTMDCFLSIHTEDFNKSSWCQQEIGFAISRNVEIIPIKTVGKKSKHEILPEGFASKIQAIRALEINKLVPIICNAIGESEKIGELYKMLNPIKKKEDDDEIPF